MLFGVLMFVVVCCLLGVAGDWRLLVRFGWV